MLRRPRRRTVVLAVTGSIGLWLLVAAWLLLDARSALESGRTGLQKVRTGATPATLFDPETGRALARAGTHFAEARSRLRSPVLSPLRLVPVVGRHLRAGDRIVATSRKATRLAQDGVDDLQALADRPVGTGSERLAVLDDLSAVVRRAEDGLAGLDPGSSAALIGPLGDAVDELRTERDDSRASLGRSGQAIRAVRRVLQGPSPYLLLGANNAEMRAGSGMFLSAAPLGFDRGDLELGDVRPTQSLFLPAGSVPVTGDLAANWPWLDPGRDLRTLGLTADFPQSATLAAANWARVRGGGVVGGVIAVDVDAVRGLLRAVGPVEVDGIRYTADSVRGELLRGQYRRFRGDRQERRDQLGAVAEEVFARIQAGEFELEAMATALVDAVQRRNLLVWSADGDVQRAWATAGADGRLRADSVSVALLNRGAEKLDSFLDTTATLVTRRRDDRRLAVTLSYRIANRAPASGPRYLIGPNIEGFVPGEHRGIAVVNLPAGTTDVRVEGARQILSGSDGPTVVVAGDLRLLRGDTTTVRVTAVLPATLDAVVIEPSARIPRTAWTVDGQTFTIDRRRTVGVTP